MRNKIIEKFSSHQGLADAALHAIVKDVSERTGFVPGEEVQRRFILDVSKTWRVRIEGRFEGKSASLRIENLKLEIDEESIRQKFRAQSEGSRIRPPHTYAHEPFDDGKGYGWSLDESVHAPTLFEPDMRPFLAASAFSSFYDELRRLEIKPFWDMKPEEQQLTHTQIETWAKISSELEPERSARVSDIVAQLKQELLAAPIAPLRFQHAHLVGTDVRVVDLGAHRKEYVVFANHFWSWRQEAYDMSFPIWGQWLALPPSRRTPERIEEVTTMWLVQLQEGNPTWFDLKSLKLMLLNRLYGALLVDVPAMRKREKPHALDALENALIVEAERLLG